MSKEAAMLYLLKKKAEMSKHNPNECQRKRSRKHLIKYVLLAALAVLLAYLDWLYFGRNQF